MEAQILEQHDAAGRPRSSIAGLRRFADAVVGEGDRPLEQLRKPRRDRPQRVLRIRLALRPPEMRAEDDASRRRARARTRSSAATRGSACRRSIVPFLIGTLKSTRISTRRPSSVRSLMRPSRHATGPSWRGDEPGRRSGSSSPTRCRTTRAPSRSRRPSRFVYGASTIDECGLPLKSIDTSGSVDVLAGCPSAARRRRLERGVDLVGRTSSCRRAPRGRRTETFGVGTRIAMPSSLPFSSGSTSPTAERRAGRRRDDRQRRGARAAQVLVRQVEQLLVVRVGVASSSSSPS